MRESDEAWIDKFPNHFARWRHLEDTAPRALADERVSVGQPAGAATV